MPLHHRLRPNNSDGAKDAGTATIEADEQHSIDPTQLQSATRPTLKDVKLMSQRQHFRLNCCCDLKQSHRKRMKSRPIAIIWRLCSDSTATTSQLRFSEATTVSLVEPHVTHDGWEIHTHTCAKCGPTRTTVVPGTAAPPQAA
jgi:hypothetical protein